MRIAVDLMGGDTPPLELWSSLVQELVAVRTLLPQNSTIVALLTADIAAALPPHSGDIIIVTAPTFIAMEDDPLVAVRRKVDSTLMTGITLLATGEIDGLVSCGNTGALVAAAALHLPLLQGLSSPPLLTTLPSRHGKVVLLDAGGSLSATPSQLLRYGLLGASYSRHLLGKELPTVALLNIGEEPIKGSATHREAYRLLSAASTSTPSLFTFAGNIEGSDLFRTPVDVVVCEGFAGNVLLKTSEGLGLWILEELQTLLPPESLELLRRRLDHRHYPGALLCGLDKPIIKCHGSSSSKALVPSLLFASELLTTHALKALLQEWSP